MDNDLQNNLQETFQSLPKELQEAISAADLPRKLEAVTKDNKLMIDQAGKVQNETVLVLLGLEPLENYVDNLVKNVGLSKETAEAVANDVNELIFKNVRKTLEKISEEDKTAETEETIPAAENPVETKTKNEDTLLPEIYPETVLPAQSILTKQEPYHENVSPVENIVQSKMTETIIVPKKNIVVEEKSKLPEKSQPSDSSDPYREPII